MLDLGFLPQIREVLRRLPRERQTMMFSATMPDSIEMIAREFMRQPVMIDIAPKGPAAGITHRLYPVRPEDQRNARVALPNEEHGRTLVLDRGKVRAQALQP